MDLVAPGDLGFASCDASPTFSGCTNFLGQPSIVEEAGGTSQSAPLTAGAAALVIEAYRKTHHGASPTPALVKQILTSTATDLGTPATEQGSGLVNTYKAVLLAQSIDNGRAARGPIPAAVEDAAERHRRAGQHAELAGDGDQHRRAAADSRGEWPDLRTGQNVQTGTITLTDGKSPQFANYQGIQNNYGMFTFKVPFGQDRLDAVDCLPCPGRRGQQRRVSA